MSLSNAWENLVIGHALCGESWTPPTTFYLSLHSSDPGDAAASSEVSGGGYARQSTTFTRSENVATNFTAVQFPEATADHGTVTHFGVWTASSGGTLVGSGAVAVSKTYNEGEIIRFPAASATVTID